MEAEEGLDLEESVPLQAGGEKGESRVSLIQPARPKKQTESYSWACLWDEIK